MWNKSAEPPQRILIMCGNDATPIVAANVYARAFQDREVVFIEEKILTLSRFATFSQRRLQRQGPASLLGVYANYVAAFLRKGTREQKGYEPVLTTPSLSKDPEVLRFIAKYQPDVIIIGFCGLLSIEFLSHITCPIYNTHPGINPRYRGFGNIWACYEKNYGCMGYTIHAVDGGIDTGEPIVVEPVDFHTVPFSELDSHVARLAARRLANLLKGEGEPHIPEQFINLESRYYGIPTLSQYRQAQANYEAHWAQGANNHGNSAHSL